MSFKTQFSLDKLVRVLTRWPLFFILPFLMVVIAVAFYVSTLKVFQVNSVVLFESNYIPIEEYFTLLDKFEEQPVQIVRSLLYGQPVERIVGKVWPSTKNNIPARNGKIGHLRSRSGVQLRFQRDNPKALMVSYENKNAEEAYKVVSTVLQELIDFNKEVTEKRLSKGVEFLTKELTVTREDLGELEQKIVRVRSGLPLAILEGHDAQTEGIEGLLDLVPVDYDIEKNLSKALRFNESIAELEFQLEIAKKELTQLQESLKTGDYLTNAESLAVVLNSDQDPEVQSLSKLVIQKKQELSQLKSKGFRNAHPDIVRMKKEIQNLNNLKSQKIISIQKKLSSDGEELTKLRLEQYQNKQIEEKTQSIGLLSDRLKATKTYRARFDDKNLTLDQKLKELSDRKSMLLELENKKIVTSHSYAQMAKRLAVLKREGRVDQDEFGLAVKIVEPPAVPANPKALAWVPVVLLVVAVTLAILFGIAATIALLDSKIYSVQDLAAVTGLPVLGSVDTFAFASDRSRRKSKYIYAGIFLLIYTLIVFLFFQSK